MQLTNTLYPIISWSTFGLTAILIAAIAILYFRLIAPELTEANYRQENRKYNVRLIDRLISLTLISIALIVFVLVRPSFHFPIVAAILLVFHRAAFNFAQGTIIIQELDLIEGQEITCGPFRGVLQRLRWTGALVADGGRLTFIPYSNLAKNAVQVVQQDVPTLLTIRCRWPEKDDRLAHTIIENVFFDYPYVIDGTKPVWVFGDQSVDVSVAVSNPKYLDSLCEVLQQKQIQAEVVN